MNEYSDECVLTFLKNQGQLFSEPVAETMEEAEAFMQEYRKLMLANKGKSYFSVTTLDGTEDSFGPIYCNLNGSEPANAMKNCVSFSWYFLRKYVDKAVPSPIGNGFEVVSNLSSTGYPTGNQPRPYAIFSWSNGGYGHTGVVLGVIDDNTFIVGESSCSASHEAPMAAQAAQYRLDDGHNWTFAYTDQWIKF